MPNGKDKLWVTTATAISTFATDVITSSEWADPTVMVKDGQGVLKSTAFIRINKEPKTPTGGSYINPNPEFDSEIGEEWSDGIPPGDKKLWASTRIFTTDGLEPQQEAWTKPEVMVDSAGFDVEFSSEEEPGIPGGPPNEGDMKNPNWSNTADETTIWMATSNFKNGMWSEWSIFRIKGETGDDGLHGVNTATIYLYKRYSGLKTNIPMPIDTLTYNFTNEELKGDTNEWVRNIPAGSNQLYVIGATASSRTDTDEIHANEWSDAVELATNGFNSASISLYQRGDTVPLVPQGDCVYTFSTGALTNITQQGWSRTIPSVTSDKKQLYITTATAISTEPTDIISNEEWADPAIMAEDGIAKFKSTVFIKSIGTPAIPTGGE